MSWEDTLKSLVSYDGVKSGVIAGNEGTIWASSADLKPTAEEIKKIVEVARNGTSESFTLAGKRVMCLRSGENELDGRASGIAVSAKVLNTAVIIVANTDPQEAMGIAQKLNTACLEIGKHLSGY